MKSLKISYVLYEGKSILRQFRELGGLNVTITGGEIFLHKDLMEIIQETRKLYLRVFLLTNASLIADSIAAKLRELNIAEISVSVYSMSTSEHDRITCQEGSLSRTLAGTLLCAALTGCLAVMRGVRLLLLPYWLICLLGVEGVRTWRRRGSVDCGRNLQIQPVVGRR